MPIKEIAPGAAIGGREFVVYSALKNKFYRRAYSGISHSWMPLGSLPNGFYPNYAPAAAIAQDKFFVVASKAGSGSTLYRYDPANGGWQSYGSPPGTAIASQISEVMYGNRVYMVGADKALYEMKFSQSGYVWFKFPVTELLAQKPPCVLVDGKLFYINDQGQVVQMWWKTSTNTWEYHNHGWPEQAATWWWPWLTTTVRAVHLGAPMPATSKLFVSCSDGTLRQLYFDGNVWRWFNHGQSPAGWVDSAAATVADGKLHVACSTNTKVSTVDKHLCELYYNGSQWIWFNHGAPGPSAPLAYEAVSDAASQRTYVLGKSQYVERFWNGNSWQWVSHGTP